MSVLIIVLAISQFNWTGKMVNSEDLQKAREETIKKIANVHIDLQKEDFTLRKKL